MISAGTVALVMAALAAPVAPASRGAAGAVPQTTPCQVEVPEGSRERWQEVRAEGFTFCVPGDWRPDGERGWRGRGGSVTWGTGKPGPVTGVATEVVAVEVQPGMTEREIERAAEEKLSLRAPRSRQFSEVVDGKRAEMWQMDMDNVVHTGAQWDAPQVFLMGRARNERAARLQLGIFRTVRFAAATN